VFYGLDPESGEPIWTYDITLDGEQTSFHGDMLITDELVIIGTDAGEGHVYAFEKDSGSVRWMFPAGRGVSTDIVRQGPHLFAVTLDDHIISLELDSGELRWSVETGADPPERFTMGSTPAVLGSHVYVGGLDGAVRCLSADNGTPVWKTPLGEEVVTSTLLVDDEIIVGTADARFHRMRATDGEVVGSVEVSQRARSHLIRLPNGLFTAFLGDHGWEGELVAFDAALGQRWRVEAPDGSTWVSARPFVVGPWVIAGSQTGHIYAIDCGDGTVAWSHAVNEDLDWSGDGVRVFGLHDSTLLVGTISGTMYAFDLDVPQKK